MTIRRKRRYVVFCLCYSACIVPWAHSTQTHDLAKQSTLVPISHAAAHHILGDAKRTQLLEFVGNKTLAQSSDEKCKYIGNRYSGKFHLPCCPFEQVMDVRNVIAFRFRRDAITAGYIPCRYCLPPIVKRVSCVLLNRSLTQPGK